MKELKCPKCGNVFSVDEADYAMLLNQVKNAEFEAELTHRIHEIEQINKLQLQAQIQALQAQIQQAEQAKQLAVAEVRQKATESYMKKEQELAQAKTQWAEQLKAAQEQIKAAQTLAEILHCNLPKVGEFIETNFAGRTIRFWRMPSSSRAYPLSLDKKAAAY